MPLGWMSTIQCNWLRWSNWDRTADLTSPCVCSASKMPNIKHPYQLHPYEMSGDCPESNHYILLLCRKLIFIYIIRIAGKMYQKSKLQWCLYMNFYQSYEDLWTGSTQQEGWVGPCPTPAGSSTAWPVMHGTATRQLYQANSPHVKMYFPDEIVSISFSISWGNQWPPLGSMNADWGMLETNGA